MSQARNAAKNILWLWCLTPVRHVLQFFVAVLTFRHFGADKLGLLALVLSLTELVKLTSKGWLRTLMKRDVAQQHDHTAELWSTYCACVLLVTLPVVALGLAGVWLAVPTQSTAILASLGLLWALVNCLNLGPVFDGWHRSRNAAQLLTAARVTRSVLVAAIVLVWQVEEIYWLVAASLLTETICVVAQHVVFSRGVTRLSWCPSRQTFLRQLKLCPHFLVMAAVAAVVGRVHVWALRLFVGQAALGVYSAASRLIVPLRPYWTSVLRVTRPLYYEAAVKGRAQMNRIISADLRLLSLVGVPLTLAGVLFAEPLIVLIYGQGGLAVAAPFAILCAEPMLASLARRASTLLIAYHRVGAAVALSSVVAVFLVGATVATTALIGTTGPAWSEIARLMLCVVVGHLMLRRSFRIPWVRLLWPAAISGGAMAAAVLAAAPYMPLGAQIGVGLGAYATCWAVICYLDRDMAAAFSGLLRSVIGRTRGASQEDTDACALPQQDPDGLEGEPWPPDASGEPTDPRIPAPQAGPDTKHPSDEDNTC